MILLTVGRVYGGQKINGMSLCFLSPPPCVSEAAENRLMISRIRIEIPPSTEGVNTSESKDT